MKIFRPILSLILVLATTLLVSCSGATVAAPPTYTPEKLQQIKIYRIPLDVARQRIPELGKSISSEDWVNANTFLHGPLGLIRRDLTYLSNALLPDEQEAALNSAKDIFKHFENIDVAVADKNYTTAIDQYKKVVSDLDTYASLIPQTEAPVSQTTKPINQVKRAIKKVEEPINQPEKAKDQPENIENIFEGVKTKIEATIEEIAPDFDDDVSK